MGLSLKRDYALDIVRVICTFWIIGVWHLCNYCESTTFISSSTLCSNVTITVLSCFMFLSGYLLKKYEFCKKTDVLAFYKKRFFRFWILFFVASSALYVAGEFIGSKWFVSFLQYFFTIIGISSFFSPHPPTLWFMSMVMLFYIITPFLLWSNRRKNVIVAWGGGNFSYNIINKTVP